MVNMLERTDSTKRYATVIRQLLPVVTKVYAAKDPQEAVNTLVSSVLGPYLEKVIEIAILFYSDTILRSTVSKYLICIAILLGRFSQ